jgi:glutathione synthase/RimK-type ligase-like ATP-grasp enzyme
VNKILILAHPDDVHAQAVEIWLKAFGAEYDYFSFGDFPQNCGISFSLDGQNTNFNLSSKERSINFYDYSAVWYRRPREPVPSKSLSREVQHYSFQECEAFLKGIAFLMPNAFWLPSYYSNQIANHKPYQLQLAQELGIVIPKTYFGNDLQEFLRQGFTEETVIVKSLYRGEIKQPLSIPQKMLLGWIRSKNWLSRNKSGENFYGNHVYAPTQKIELESLRKKPELLKICPICIQEYVPGVFELRITVVGDEVFACAIQMPSSRAGEVDWRLSDKINAYKFFQLPDDVETKCRMIVKKLGLHFGCIDMIVSENGDYYFLECNPNGQWLWIEHETGMLISRAIAQLLLNPPTTNLEGN